MGLATEFRLPFATVASDAPTTASVRCLNRAGLGLGGSLGPISFDDTPPTIGAGALAVGASGGGGGGGVVGLGPQGGGRLYVGGASLTLAFDPSAVADAESGVQHVKLIVRATDKVLIEEIGDEIRTMIGSLSGEVIEDDRSW